MDKAKTLEVLRSMKFMQRKEEAKRRATFEVAQREEIERHLHADDSGNVAASGQRGGPARATLLYDDAVPASFYGLARRSFTDALGEPSSVVEDKEAVDGRSSSKVPRASSPNAASAAAATQPYADDNAVFDSDEESLEEDLWEEKRGELDPTAASQRAGSRKGHATPQTRTRTNASSRSDGRFTVQAAVRAPKLPRRLEEAVTEEERQRKRRRAEDSGDMDFV
jgi:hypothetical protein